MRGVGHWLTQDQSERQGTGDWIRAWGWLELLAKAASEGHVDGVDYSAEMVEQATARNVKAIENGRISLRFGSVESLPYEDNTFDKAIAINSMQVWPDSAAGLREIRRTLRIGGSIALGFTPHSGQSKDGLPELLRAAAFSDVKMIETELGFCVQALKI